ncbi:MAG: hypothetical protein AB1374_01845 [Bacillota bacterium]
MLPLSYYFYKKALAKSFGPNVSLIYQYSDAPGEYPGAADLAARIRVDGLSLPVLAVGQEIVMVGRLPTIEEFLVEVKARVHAELCEDGI